MAISIRSSWPDTTNRGRWPIVQMCCHLSNRLCSIFLDLFYYNSSIVMWCWCMNIVHITTSNGQLVLWVPFCQMFPDESLNFQFNHKFCRFNTLSTSIRATNLHTGELSKCSCTTSGNVLNFTLSTGNWIPSHRITKCTLEIYCNIFIKFTWNEQFQNENVY